MSLTSFDSLETLPVFSRRQDILQSVTDNQVTIITAETGAGKSTQVPQYLALHGFQKIIVTQPRILAARNLSDRVRQEYSYRLGSDASALVGYRTAHERDDAPENVILYCTDGLQLVRELTGSGTTGQQILVLDEVHEWNENMEVLVAWAKKRCQEDPLFKVVLMSATIDATSLAAYYNTPAPITVAGRSFPVTKQHSDDLAQQVIDLLQSRTSNMLVFLPGKAEIEGLIELLQPLAGTVPLLPLHSQLDAETQQLAFASYPQGKIVLSTNIAQTSITIDDIDVVIDSGLERRAEVRSGIEGLFIEEISQADCLQRAGRAGRTKAGLYVLAKLGSLPCSPLDDRAEYGVPEILRKHIDRLVLRLANIGIDIEDLDFYHAPSRKTVKYAKQTLISLGALTNRQEVTNIGREMERFPVESMYARMLVAAKAYSPELQAQMAAIIAIQEVGGIVKGGPRYTGWRKYSRQSQSDLIAQYEVFLALEQIDPAEYEDMGIIGKNIDKAQEIINRLLHDLGLSEQPLLAVTADDLPNLQRCIVAGQLHQLWATNGDGQAIHIATNKSREISSSSVVKQASLLAGTPFDLQVPTAAGLETLHLVNQLTAVDPSWLTELAPDRFTVKPGKVYFDPKYGTLAAHTQLQYGGQLFSTASTPRLERTPENQRQFTSQYSIWLHEQLEKERRNLQAINFRKIPEVPVKQVQQQVRHIADGAVSLLELSKAQRIELSKLGKLETYLGNRFMAGLIQSDDGKHKKRHGFKRQWKFNPKKHFKRKHDGRDPR
ncbi:MAG: helicase-related protein [Patescibacteria group bacterium]|nr:helicase-related protein [Patescibacteria group bacterium]